MISWSDLGSFGVDLFFVLSGFLITGILLDSRDSPAYYMSFYGRRFLRLFPIYYSYLLVLALLVAPLHKMAGTSMADYSGPWWWYIAYFCNWKPNHAVGDPNLGHFWSLAIEEQFYLAWPLLIRVLPWKWIFRTCVALIVFSTLLRCLWSVQGVEWNTIYRLTVTRLDPLAMGAVMALALRSARWRSDAVRLSPALAVLGIGGLLATSLLAGGPQWSRPLVQTLGALLAALGFSGVVLFAATRTGGWVHRILCSSPLTLLGRYSYCMYVIHILVLTHAGWTIQFVLRRAPGVPWWLQPLGLIAANLLVFLVAQASWRYIESPILSGGRRWLDHKLATARSVSLRMD